MINICPHKKSRNCCNKKATLKFWLSMLLKEKTKMAFRIIAYIKWIIEKTKEAMAALEIKANPATSAGVNVNMCFITLSFNGDCCRYDL